MRQQGHPLAQGGRQARVEQRAGLPVTVACGQVGEQDVVGGEVVRPLHELVEVDAQLGQPSIYEAAHAERLTELQARREALPDELAGLYARWEELESIAQQAGS